MQQLQTITDQYSQNGFNESIIYALASKMHNGIYGSEISTEEIFKTSIWKFKPGRQIKELSVTR
ncbi:hypothetical protein KKE68_06415, partial [Patescibacteria group bacterium]|nr:hypothetical protein [Patescibacteria group bacterium]